jgi:hypothetical protein
VISRHRRQRILDHLLFILGKSERTEGAGHLVPASPRIDYTGAITGPTRSRPEVLAVLRAHEAELRARGVETLTLFGSMERGDATGASDVDSPVRPGARVFRGRVRSFRPAGRAPRSPECIAGVRRA